MYKQLGKLGFFAAFLFTTTLLSAQEKEVIILHTNDTHSQIDPNPSTATRNPDEGGVLRRAVAIEEIRKENANVILVDAGDFVQGTPYYNFFGGEVEVKMMNKLGYQAATLGNHEFDNGLEPLAKILAMAEFPILCANYDVTGTPLAPYVKKTTVIELDGIKVGFIGVGVDPEGLISKKNFEGIKFLDPSETVNKYARELREQGCDVVAVISHVGYFKNDKSGDRYIAAQSTDIDLIIGGHTHTALDGCVEVINQKGKPVRITQTMGRGFRLGRLDIEVEKK
ncbi:MAG: metallophosphoesterase [Bacteroidales bacterium]